MEEANSSNNIKNIVDFFANTELSNVPKRRHANDFPENLNILIDTSISFKYNKINNIFFQHNQYLPFEIQRINIIDKIQEVNVKLIEISSKYKFERLQNKSFDNLVDMRDEEDKKINLFGLCIHSLTEEDYTKYINFKITEIELNEIYKSYLNTYSDKVKISLPNFELITDYLSLITYFDGLVEDFETSKSENFDSDSIPQDLTSKNRFNSNLNLSQLHLLYTSLIQNKFISNNVSIDEFNWAFGIDNNNVYFSYIQWVKSKSLAVYLIDSLYGFNFLNNVEKMWAIGSKVFGIRFMAQIKQNYISINKNGKPKGYEKIDDIISAL